MVNVKPHDTAGARLGASIKTLIRAAVIALVIPGHGLAQTEEEQRYAAEVGEASAQASAQNRVERADRALTSVPVSLTARRDAIADMQAALDDVRRQIARAEEARSPARLRRVQAELEADRLFDEVQTLRRQVRDLEPDYDRARSRIELARERLNAARDRLNLAQDNARIFLADTAPPAAGEAVIVTPSLPGPGYLFVEAESPEQPVTARIVDTKRSYAGRQCRARQPG
jgi:hypothetical protein